MASIVIKPQKCGRKNCRCYRGTQENSNPQPHGDYYWLVEYIGYETTSDGKGKSKYRWSFLGKSKESAIKTLQEAKPELLNMSDDKSIKKIQEKLDYKPPITLGSKEMAKIINDAVFS